MNPQVDAVFSILVILFSIIIHEIAHGYVAYLYGDRTAHDSGRLTLNPIPHIDIFGSIIVPVMCYLAGWPTVGWAKPVPYNPRNFRNEIAGTRAVAFAGIVANLILVAVFSILIHYRAVLHIPAGALSIMAMVVLINFVLAAFNLLPIPPLDGSKILASFGGARMRAAVEYPRGIMMIFFFIIAFTIWNFISSYIFKIFEFLVQ